MSQIENKIKKLYALAMRGVGGEKENAERMMNQLLDREGLSIEDIISEKRIRYGWSYKTSHDRSIIVQVLYRVQDDRGDDAKVWSSKYPRCRVSAKLTKAEYMLADMMIVFHRSQWRKERLRTLEALEIAYLNKHNLLSEPSEDDPIPDVTPESLEKWSRIASMQANLENKSFMKGIEK